MANRDSAIGTGAHVASHVIGGVNKVVGGIHKTARRFGKGVGHVIKRAYEEDAASLPGRHIHIHVHDAATARTSDPGIEKTMHEFKHGTLHSGSKKGPKVKSRKQAIAIGLSKQRRGDGKDDIDLGRISPTGDERRRTVGGKDAGTSEGAKKAAATRKAHGGGGQQRPQPKKNSAASAGERETPGVVNYRRHARERMAYHKKQGQTAKSEAASKAHWAAHHAYKQAHQYPFHKPSTERAEQLSKAASKHG